MGICSCNKCEKIVHIRHKVEWQITFSGLVAADPGPWTGEMDRSHSDVLFQFLHPFGFVPWNCIVKLKIQPAPLPLIHFNQATSPCTHTNRIVLISALNLDLSAPSTQLKMGDNSEWILNL